MKIRHTFRDRLFYCAINAVLLGALLLVAFPMLYIFSASFSSPAAVSSGKVWLLPVDFSLDGYLAVFKEKMIITGYWNTIVYTVLGTAISVVLTVLAAYPLSRKNLPGKRLILSAFLFTMFFSGGLIPNYLLMSSLSWINTIQVIVIPNAISVWNVMITRTFYQSNIPEDLYEAASIDGCGHMMFMWKMVLPLSKAITAVLILFYGVGYWNAYFDAFIYLNKPEMYPLQLVLREILVKNAVDPSLVMDPTILMKKQGLAELMKYSLIIVASLPVWCIYPFVQKHFVKGVMVGAIKG
jgi:putative aldouronate transport system permease protein